MLDPAPGDVESVGDGHVGGKVKEFTTKPGDTVLYSKFGLGATELAVGGREFILIREVSSFTWLSTALLLIHGTCTAPCVMHNIIAGGVKVYFVDLDSPAVCANAASASHSALSADMR